MSALVLLAVAATWQAPFSVREDAGVARTAEVVSVGVPLLRESDVRDASSLGVVDARGQAVPSQVTVLARWDARPDDEISPIRWALVSIPADVAARSTARFALVPAEKTEAGPPLAVEKDGAIEVASFATRFAKDDPGPLVLVATSPSGVTGRATSVSAVILEENGPLRAVVAIRGELSSGFDHAGGGTKPLLWSARWIFAKGERDARVHFTIENPDRPHEQPFNEKGAAREKRFSSLSLEWRGGKGDAKKHRGWIARDDRALGMRWLRENAPKALRGDGKKLALDLFPKGKAPHALQGGRAKTHEIWLAMGRDAGERAAGLSQPLRAAPDPVWLRETRALGLLSVEDATRFGSFEATLDAIGGADGAKGGRTIFDERESHLGWLHHGDSARGGDGKFGNNEFDLGWVLLRQWLREPDHDPVFLDAAEATLRHLADIDVLHTDDDIFWANRGVRKHDVDSTRDHGNVPDLSHFWIRGLVAHHFVTGDGRSRDVVEREIGAWLESREKPADSGELAWADELRDVGWTLIALTDLYELTGDAKWLVFFDRVSEVMVVRNLRDDGSMLGASFTRRKESFAPWQQAYIADGLARRAMIGRRRGVPHDGSERALRSMLGFLCGPAWIDEPLTILGRRYPRTIAFEMRDDGTKDASEASMSQAVADPAAMGWMLFREEKLRGCAKDAIEHVFPDGPEKYLVPGRSTPAKNAAIKTYFGEAARWLLQTSDGDTPKPRAETSNMRP